MMFRTKEEVYAYSDFLRAQEVIRRDAKEFKPDWRDENQTKWYGAWDHIGDEPVYARTYLHQCATIHFKSKEDIEESFEKHPEEWRTYLTYERDV